MKAFCVDDQDRDVSIVALYVQVFTVKSLVCEHVCVLHFNLHSVQQTLDEIEVL